MNYEETRKKNKLLAQQYRTEYYLQHEVCPKCKGKCYCTTYMGPVMNVEHPETYKDKNKVECMCGWSGIHHDLIPDTNQQKK